MDDIAPVGRFERTVRIRFGHCDPAGIVFYPQVLVLLNGLVEDWVEQGLGISYAGLVAQRRVGLPTVRLACDFRAVSRMGDDVVLALEVERLGNRSITLAMDITRGTEQRVAAHVVLVTTDLASHRAIAVPADLHAAILAFGPRSQSAPDTRTTP